MDDSVTFLNNVDQSRAAEDCCVRSRCRQLHRGNDLNLSVVTWFIAYVVVYGVMSCQCLVQPPVFDLPPPPDLSLVWNLISDDAHEPQADCEWGPFITITDVSSKISSTPLSIRSLVVISIIASMIFLSLCVTVICRIKRGRSRHKATKSTSSDGMLTAADNVWTYNSMKNSCSGSTSMLVCNGITHNQAYQNTPGTIRTSAFVEIQGLVTSFIRKVVRSKDTVSIFCDVKRIMEKLFLQESRISTDSPPLPRSEEGERRSGEGRESGYGTAPSRQWRSPPARYSARSLKRLTFFDAPRPLDFVPPPPLLLLLRPLINAPINGRIA
uniref:ZP domain-containing protein n=1 Tax=Angiostrongylus cantonensis TaxID=6313 RepID=A0A158P9Q7_ANGCA